jgi:DNA mismatch repair protein MutL
VNRIQRLPPELANQIAAGEVVERPASVIKELVENAIDAGAHRISIVVEFGGKKLMSVEDDGEGMGADDAMLAVERHATSKIRSTADLAAISTLGFGARLCRRSRPCRSSGCAPGCVARCRGRNCASTPARSSRAGKWARPRARSSEVGELFFNLPGPPEVPEG